MTLTATNRTESAASGSVASMTAAPSTAPQQPGVRLVHDRVPGRRRYLVDGLKGASAAALRLERRLLAVDGVVHVVASPVTGTVLILTDLAKAVGDLTAAIRSSLATGADEAEATDRDAERWHRMELDELADTLETSLTDGIDLQGVPKRLRRHGANALTRPAQRSAADLLIGQVRNLPTGLLAIASVVALATGGAVEAIAIAGAVVLNGAIGYATERRAQKTIESLCRLDQPDAVVVRGGRETTVPVASLVPGDLLVLSRGAVVPADARLVRADELTASEAALTGESLPVAKRPTPLRPGAVPLAERTNMVFRGTLITGGSGTAVVVATGMATQVGVVHRLVSSAAPPETPSRKELERLGRQIAAAALVVGGFTLGLGWVRGLALLQLLRMGLSLAVAAVPEGLPTVATTTLAFGVEQLRRRGVVIRRLHAIETLASATVVCFDKTGTLTRNEMQVTAVACGQTALQPVSASGKLEPDPLLDRLFRTAVLASELSWEDQEGRKAAGASSTECALAAAAAEHGVSVDTLAAALPRLALEPRSEGRRYIASVHALGDGRRLAAVKGSPLEVLELCAWEALADGGRQPLTDARRAAIGRLNADMADRALRVLGVADREIAEPEPEAAAAARDLTWIGLVGMTDAIRKGATETIAGLRAAGVRPVMITGDQSATAKALAEQMQLTGSRAPVVVDAFELDGLGPEALADAARRGDVFARVNPEQKLTLLQALQRSGAVVAMVGDGINDSPALRAADVGVTLGEEGSSAAQEVADVVLENDDLGGLLIALELGRATRTNIRKAIRYLLSTNGSEILVMLAALAVGFGEALSPMQILWINLISDILPGIGLGLQPPEAEVLTRGPDTRGAIVGRPEMARLGVEAAVMSAGALGACAYGALRHGRGTPRSRAMTFTSLVTAQLLHGLTCRSRSRGLFTREPPAPNRTLSGVLVLSAALQGAAFCIPPLRGLLGLSRLGLADVGVTAVAGVLPFLALETMKTRTQPSWRTRVGANGDARAPAE